MSRSIIRTITTAFAIAALAAPAALAQPAHVPPAAAGQHDQARLAQINPYPTRPAQGEQANPQPEPATTAASAPAEGDIPWTTIAIWLAAIAASAAIVRHARHSGRTRIAA